MTTKPQSVSLIDHIEQKEEELKTAALEKTKQYNLEKSKALKNITAIESALEYTGHIEVIRDEKLLELYLDYLNIAQCIEPCFLFRILNPNTKEKDVILVKASHYISKFFYYASKIQISETKMKIRNFLVKTGICQVTIGLDCFSYMKDNPETIISDILEKYYDPTSKV